MRRERVAGQHRERRGRRRAARAAALAHGIEPRLVIDQQRAGVHGLRRDRGFDECADVGEGPAGLPACRDEVGQRARGEAGGRLRSGMPAAGRDRRASSTTVLRLTARRPAPAIASPTLRAAAIGEPDRQDRHAATSPAAADRGRRSGGRPRGRG